MRAALLMAILPLTALLVGCTSTPQQSTTPTPIVTPVVTQKPSGANETIGNASLAANLTFVARQSGPPTNHTTYSLVGPTMAAAGWVSLTLRNEGVEPHQLLVLRIENGTYAQLMQNMTGGNATNASMPAVTAVGGVAGVGPNASATTTVWLGPGAYFVACFIPGANGDPHALHGMTAPLNVSRGPAGVATAPTSDVNLTMTDYKFALGANLSAGHHVLAVRNAGNHTHEAVLVKLHANKTARDFTGFFESDANMTGAPPADVVSGGGSMDPDVAAVEYVALDLAPGRYAFICFQQDAPTAAPHYAKGMTLTFDVA